MNMCDKGGFDGAKMALFVGDRLAVILRDTFPGLPYPGYWDFPGGGREGDEGPFACVQRECREELSVPVAPDQVVFRRSFDTGQRRNWFFVVRVGAAVRHHIRLGDEGQRWTLMKPATYMAHPKAVPMFQERLGIYLDGFHKAPR
tara:strand:- start:282 stop:716 length:435 start_codon:yes stop_codon:yes gene_type:complete